MISTRWGALDGMNEHQVVERMITCAVVSTVFSLRIRTRVWCVRSSNHNSRTVVSACLDKVCVLRKKAVARVHSVGTALLANADDLGNLEVAGRGGMRRDSGESV